MDKQWIGISRRYNLAAGNTQTDKGLVRYFIETAQKVPLSPSVRSSFSYFPNL